ncbi:response regulator transcription factor [Xanthocytophaga agilis]|uniref:Response regulator transcription factor n=1 Tax=Xanthocytophaga agilis TaxID=3048010 RepID=A0AAE3UHX8_9BACT|nr:response regulator transcription factor [Xanthocytophaga agilis]MDJ1505935.1 response regulator transcription factor [Xanthocytophaga agilis]
MSKDKLRILLAEDDLNLGVLLMDYLETEGFDVKLCKDGELALKAFHSHSFDLCLLDVMMPYRDGFSLAKEIRTKDKKIPVIFITARSLKEDKLKGYDLGADDYITKPFDEEELLWKIKAVIRRIPESAGEDKSEVISIGKYTFNVSNQSLTIGASTKRITEKESDILNYIAIRRNRVIKREEMLKDLWGENDYFLGRSLDVFITKIRKYLKEDPDISIENVFKVGFIFNVPPKQIEQ